MSAKGQSPPTALGEIIRRQRELSEMSMRQFASLAGISNPYLSQIERGLREPSERVLQSIAETLHTSAESLYEQAGIALGAEGEDDPESTTIAVLKADPHLTARQRQALVTAYEAFRAINGEPPRRRRRRS